MSPGLWGLVDGLRFIDLTHHFRPGQPRFPADPEAEVTRLTDAATDGFTVDHYAFAGPWGTHVDAPSHVDPDGHDLGDIPARESLLPLVVVDLPEGGELGRDHLLDWEREHGPVPAGSFVALRTGWSQRWAGGGMHAPGSPGWGVDALALLDARGVTAIGHETLDTDPGVRVAAGDFRAQRWWLGRGHWQIEALRNLAGVPATGALLLAAWPVPRGGVAFPARAIAVIRG